MWVMNVERIAALLRPYDFDSVISIDPVPGPGNWLIHFWTKGDQRMALVNHEGFVVWCYSTADHDRESHFLDLRWQYDNHEKLPLAPMDMVALINERGLAGLHLGHGPTDGVRLYTKLADHIMLHDGKRAVKELKAVCEPGRQALGAAAALGSAAIPAKATEAAEEPAGGQETAVRVQLFGHEASARIAELADRIHAAPSEDEDHDVLLDDAVMYFQQRGASVTKMVSGTRDTGIRIWWHNTYVAKIETMQGVGGIAVYLDLDLVREADRMVTELAVHV